MISKMIEFAKEDNIITDEREIILSNSRQVYEHSYPKLISFLYHNPPPRDNVININTLATRFPKTQRARKRRGGRALPEEEEDGEDEEEAI